MNSILKLEYKLKSCNTKLIYYVHLLPLLFCIEYKSIVNTIKNLKPNVKCLIPSYTSSIASNLINIWNPSDKIFF